MLHDDKYTTHLRVLAYPNFVRNMPFFVDSNRGNDRDWTHIPESPLKTITQALSYIEAQGRTSDIIHVLPGYDNLLEPAITIDVPVSITFLGTSSRLIGGTHPIFTVNADNVSIAAEKAVKEDFVRIEPGTASYIFDLQGDRTIVTGFRSDTTLMGYTHAVRLAGDMPWVYNNHFVQADIISSGSMTNCLVSENTIDMTGSGSNTGIDFSAGGTGTIKDCVVFADTPGSEIVPGSCNVIDCCDLY